MKKIVYNIIPVSFISCILFLSSASTVSKQMNEDFKKDSTEGFVVMELFTSQGCSSCPPADAVLGMYAFKNDEHIIPLAFHVDYWNRLGWVDSLSKSAFSKRQEAYAEKLNSSVYAPQLVINGQQQVVGSNSAAIATVVKKYLNEETTVSIHTGNVIVNNNKAELGYAVERATAKTNINAALVQKNVLTQITGGENRGVQLNNHNVVRDLKTNKLTKPSGKFIMEIPKGNSYENYMIVLFVQDADNGSIKSAVSKDLK